MEADLGRAGKPDPDPADEVLVKRARDGDTAAFEELVARYERRVYNLAYRYTGDREDASDLAQEAFLKAFLALRGFRGRSTFSTWLYRVTTNACLDAVRSRQRRRTVSLDQPILTVDGQVERQVSDSSVDPEELAQRREVQAVVRQAIARLSPDHRMVLVLRDLQGLAYEEVAAILGLNLGTVKSRLNRARLALRDLLAGTELLAATGVYRPDRGAAGGGDAG
ncbi:MAG: sigma-70 family RNA polymerase sigma factor [bacterium]|nr:sigma-70 family RNA polymerase sigma factor [bacterium]